MTQPEANIRTLSVFHYIVGALVAMSSILALPLLLLAYPALLVFKQLNDSKTMPPAGGLVLLIPCVGLLIIWIYAALIFTAGRFLARRKHYLYCLVMAAVECIFMPFGTVLGIFTILVLMRDPVKQLFDPQTPPPAVTSSE
jgi:hypothetical protein